MSGREYNKLAAGVLIAGLIVMITGKVVDVLYQPILDPAHRGYKIYVPEDVALDLSAVAKEEFSIDIAEEMKKASAELGEQLFKKCASCHTNTKGGANRVGPNLWNVVGADKGHHPDYNYSKAMLSAEGSWTYNDLAYYLHKPSKFIKGTKMSFAGFKKKDDIANIIAYLRYLSDSPKSLPE